MKNSTSPNSEEWLDLTVSDLLCMAEEWTQCKGSVLSAEQQAVVNLKIVLERKNGEAVRPFIFKIQKGEGVNVPERLSEWEHAKAREFGLV